MLGFLSKWLPAASNSPKDAETRDMANDGQRNDDGVLADDDEQDSDSAKIVVGSSSSSPNRHKNAAQPPSDTRMLGDVGVNVDVARNTPRASTSKAQSRRPSTPPVYEYISDDELLLTSSSSSVNESRRQPAQAARPDIHSASSSSSGTRTRNIRKSTGSSPNQPTSATSKFIPGSAARKSAPSPIQPLCSPNDRKYKGARKGQFSRRDRAVFLKQREHDAALNNARLAVEEQEQETIVAARPAAVALDKGKQRVIELTSTSDDESGDDMALDKKGTAALAALGILPTRPPTLPSFRPKPSANSSSMPASAPANSAVASSSKLAADEPKRRKRQREPSVELEVPPRSSPSKKGPQGSASKPAKPLPLSTAILAEAAASAKADTRPKLVARPPDSLSLLPDAPANAKPPSPYWHLVWAAIAGLAAAGQAHPDAGKMLSGKGDVSKLIGGVTVMQILKAVCFRYPYYLTAFADGSLEKSITAALQGRPCFRYYKLDGGLSLWYLDKDIGTTSKKAEYLAKTKAAALSASTASKRLDGPSSAPAAPFEEPIPAPLPEAPDQIFATSLSHLPEIPPGQVVPYPVWTLARAAILGSQYRRLKLDQIAQAILGKYPQLASVELKTKSPDNRLLHWIKSNLNEPLSKHLCFFYARTGRVVGNWLVDLEIDPRERNVRGGNKAEKTRLYGGYNVGDPGKTSLDAMEGFLLNMQKLSEAREERYKRREAILEALEPPPLPPQLAPVVPKPAPQPQPTMQETAARQYTPIAPKPARSAPVQSTSQLPSGAAQPSSSRLLQPDLPRLPVVAPGQGLAAGSIAVMQEFEVGMPRKDRSPGSGKARLSESIGEGPSRDRAMSIELPEPPTSVPQKRGRGRPPGTIKERLSRAIELDKLGSEELVEPPAHAQPSHSSSKPLAKAASGQGRKSLSGPARTVSPEIEEILPSARKKQKVTGQAGPSGSSGKHSLQAGRSIRIDKSVSLIGSASEPGSLEWSDTSKPQCKANSSAGPPTPIALSSTATPAESVSSRSASPDAMPIPQFICGYIGRKQPEPCDKTFFTTQERDSHLRYVHAQKSDSYDWKQRMAAKAEAELQAEMEAVAEEAKRKKAEARKRAKAKAAANKGVEVIVSGGSQKKLPAHQDGPSALSKR